MDYEELKEAVMKFFEDTSRSQSETKADLRGIIEEIETLIETLDDDE